jgi:hypothetical protein
MPHKFTYMKYLFLVIGLILGIQTYAQDIAGCDSVALKTDAEMTAAEPCIKKLSAYALTQPMIGCNSEGHYARKVVYAWVEGTEDHSFSLNKHIMKIFNDDNLLLFTTYTACLANAAVVKGEKFEKYALELFVNYLKNKDNKVDQSSAVVKLLADWKDSKVDKYLK